MVLHEFEARLVYIVSCKPSKYEALSRFLKTCGVGCFEDILSPKALPRKYPKVLPQEGEGLSPTYSVVWWIRDLQRSLLPGLKLQCSGMGHRHQACSLATEDNSLVTYRGSKHFQASQNLCKCITPSATPVSSPFLLCLCTAQACSASVPILYFSS